MGLAAVGTGVEGYYGSTAGAAGYGYAELLGGEPALDPILAAVQVAADRHGLGPLGNDGPLALIGEMDGQTYLDELSIRELERVQYLRKKFAYYVPWDKVWEYLGDPHNIFHRDFAEAINARLPTDEYLHNIPAIEPEDSRYSTGYENNHDPLSQEIGVKNWRTGTLTRWKAHFGIKFMGNLAVLERSPTMATGLIGDYPIRISFYSGLSMSPLERLTS